MEGDAVDDGKWPAVLDLPYYRGEKLTYVDGLAGTPVNKLFMLIGLQSKPASSNTQHQHHAGKHTLLYMADGHAFRYMPSGDNPSERLGYAAQH